MNKKRIWYILPTVILPYLTLFMATLILFSTGRGFGFIMEVIFMGNGLYVVGALVLFCIFAAALSAVCFAVSVRKGWDPLSLAKCAMIVKLVQVPAFILIFMLSVPLALTVFGIPFVVGLFLIDCLTLFLTGLLTAAAAVNAVRQGIFGGAEVIRLLLLQLVFCTDVFACIAFYKRCRRRYRSLSAEHGADA